MKEKILFSPIGMTDPTSKNYDGSFLHIIRNYSPHTAYIFLTEEIADIDKKDNRYEEMAHHVMPEIAIKKEYQKGIASPNDFNIFDDQFKEIIFRIKSEHPESEILLNISSGTPQMKSSLYMLSATLPFPVNLIQVNTPEAKSNIDKKKIDDYDLEYEKNNLMDMMMDGVEIKNRCHEVTPENVIKQNMISSIESHLRHYDYSAARTIAQMDKELFPEKIQELLNMAKLRAELDNRSADLISKKYSMDIFPLKSSDAIKEFEYMLYLIKTQKKQSLNDFSRGISPIIFNIFKALLEKTAPVNIEKDYCFYDKNNNMYRLSRNKLAQNPDLIDFFDNSQYFKGEFKDSPLAAVNILIMIDYFSKDYSLLRDAFKKCETLRKIEESIRNQAAHEIVSISEEAFSKSTGYSSSTIIKFLKELFELAFSDYRKNIKWDSYDEMNEKLIAILKTPKNINI